MTPHNSAGEDGGPNETSEDSEFGPDYPDSLDDESEDDIYGLWI